MILDPVPMPQMAPACRMTPGLCDGVAVLHIQGELVTGSAGVLRAELAEVVGTSKVLMELSGVTWLDSVGLEALIGAVRSIQEAGGQVALAGARSSADALLRSAGVDRLAVLAESAEAALRSLLAS